MARALDDNESLIEAALTRGRSDKELKLEADIDKLARVRNIEDVHKVKIIYLLLI